MVVMNIKERSSFSGARNNYEGVLKYIPYSNFDDNYFIFTKLFTIFVNIEIFDFRLGQSSCLQFIPLQDSPTSY